ncbi:MAG: STAS domain-containing protein [Magnetococcales bacterium]|nr:STAS domain-containing protein [Magnetococcales bacterium]
MKQLLKGFGMGVEINQVGNKMILTIHGEFGLNCNQSFHDFFKSNIKNQKEREFIVDFKDVTYISSIGAGLLIQLREFGGGSEADISLVNVNERTMKLLTVLNFSQLFKISAQ